MTNELTIFNYENNQVRNVVIKGEPWFVANDIAKNINFFAKSA